MARTNLTADMSPEWQLQGRSRVLGRVHFTLAGVVCGTKRREGGTPYNLRGGIPCVGKLCSFRNRSEIFPKKSKIWQNIEVIAES